VEVVVSAERWRRARWVIPTVLVVLAVSGVIAYRVFAPHETLTRPTVAYPENVVITDPRPFSELRAAPLVVENRLRIYAEKWRVWADAPVGERYESTPYWAFRRWPAQVVGVATAQTSNGPVVVTQWSDGELVALDARKGAIAWRATAAIDPSSYDGRRTGASVVYEPRSLLTARTADQNVVMVIGSHGVHAFDAASGKSLWQKDLPTGCEPTPWTGNGLLVVPECDTSTIHLIGVTDGAEQASWTSPTVPPTPALCELGRVECRMVQVGEQVWLLGADAHLTGVPPLEKGAFLSGDRVVYPVYGGVAARGLTDTALLWSWTGRGDLIAADAVGVYLITEDRTVLSLSPATGHLVALGCASSAPNESWKIGHIYPTGGSYLALERINTSVSSNAADQQYYFGPRPVALVELYPPTKLPVWPGKFAACRPAA
jgi:outer membrane protein assembly factor BamB